MTELTLPVDECLSGLESMDLIRARSRQPDLEYIFKHALTQEVVYNGVLKKERQEIHERIGLAMEKLFNDRMPEFFETLAFHFSNGRSVEKAVYYLIKSGEKNLVRYSVKEAHQYFRKAYNLLISKEVLTESDNIILINILNSWGYSFYYLGEIKEWIDIFSSHKDHAESLDDNAKTGMFYAWFGIAYYMAGKPKASYEYLCKGLELGENAANQKVVGYACAWLPFTCAELGLFDEGISYGERAQKIAESYPADPYLYFKSLAGICFIYFFMGDTHRLFDGAEGLLKYGIKNSNNRSIVFGHFMKAFGYWSAGNMKSAQKSSKTAIEVALDPLYAQFPKVTLGITYFLGGQIQEAENVLLSGIKFCENRALDEFSVVYQYFMGPVLIAKGQMQKGADLPERDRFPIVHQMRRLRSTRLGSDRESRCSERGGEGDSPALLVDPG